jgi:hypothetical protein
MDECEFCEVRCSSVEMNWTLDLKELACKGCYEILQGIQAYKEVFKVEYILPKK